jgi:methylated-DNA-[protein]-cysteine S-methyltransferase
MKRMQELRAIDVEDASRRAAAGVSDRASRWDLVDVAYAEVDSPIGTLLVASTRGGLVRLAYPEEPFENVLVELAETISPRVLEARRMTDPVRRELEAYFAGAVQRFRARVDWTLTAPGFSRRVLQETARIPFGSVSTYRHVAGRAGSPRAARAAGNALHDNPVPIVVPCHRVVPSSGGIGKYGGNEWRKAFLLRLEGAVEA